MMSATGNNNRASNGALHAAMRYTIFLLLILHLRIKQIGKSRLQMNNLSPKGLFTLFSLASDNVGDKPFPSLYSV